jgi:hypothetical protein
MVPYAIVGTADESPFPRAHVARLPKGETKKSAVLVARSMQYLTVRVLFHRSPVAGIQVQFGAISGVDDGSPEKMDPVLTTDDRGVACFPRLVVAGIYSCEVERQPATVVPTVGNLRQPHPVVLPVGRPLVDVGSVDEFKFEGPDELPADST